MSIANPAVYSNGNKTVTISLKSNYKWSNGQPITANDLLFDIDLIKAAVKASPANWAGYVPGHFPDNLVSTSEPNSTTLVMNLSVTGQPDLVHQGRPRPGTADPAAQLPVGQDVGERFGRARRPAGPRPPWRSIFKYLTARGQVAQHLRDQPAVAGGRRAVQALGLQHHQRRVHDGAEHHLRRPARDADVLLPGCSVHLEHRGVQRDQVGQHRRRLRRLQRRAAAARGPAARLQLLRHAGLRHDLRRLQLQGQDRRLQQHHRPAVHPPGAGAPGGPAGLDHRVHARRGRACLRAHPGLPAEPVPAVQRGDQPVPVQRLHGRQPPEEPRLERGARRHGHVREAGHRHPPSAGRASRPAPSWRGTSSTAPLPR